MPYRNEVQPLNLFGDFLAGKQAAISQQGAQQTNALRGLQVQQAQNINALASNPSATPEQYIRAGDAQTGNALATNQQQQQMDKQQALGQLAGLAQKALTITDPAQRKSFLMQAGQTYGPAFAAVGADHTTGLSQLQGLPDDQLTQRLQQVAQFAAPPAPIKLGADETLLTPPSVAGGAYTPVATGTPKDNVDYKDAGDRLIPVDKKTGAVIPGLKPIQKGMPPSSGYTQDSVDTTAQMIASNQIPMLSGFALKTPWGQAVVAKVGQISPDYQGGQYGAQASTMKAFASGTESRSVRSLNVAISHLDTLSTLSQALDSGDIQALNKIAVRWKTETGNPAPTSFTSARDIVANEVVKAVTASGGTLADRQEAQTQIQAAASPAQLAGVIQTWKQLLGGQLGGLQQQYEQGTGQKDFQRFLSPNVVKQLEGQGGQETQQKGGGPVRVNSPQEAMALAPGTVFITPDGRQKVR